MPLVSGQRLDGADRNAYVVGERLSSTPWYELYAARKVFFNFRYDDREFYEAADDEWADVRLRVSRRPESEDRNEVNRRRRRLRYELTEVLGGHGGWCPEPLDWLEDAGGESVLVMSASHGETLHNWRRTQNEAKPRCLDVVAELLDLLESLHVKRQVVGGFGPDDFVIDETGRLGFLATDRVLPAKRAVPLRRYFPPERFPALFSPPEAGDPVAALGPRSDLFSWAALALFLLTGSTLESDFGSSGNHLTETGSGIDEQLQNALKEIAVRDSDSLQSLLPREKRALKGDLVAAWRSCLGRCLAFDPSARPGSVNELRQMALSDSRVGSVLSRLWRSVRPRPGRS